MKRAIVLLLVLCIGMTIHADEIQSTVVVGEVYDSNTLEPLENIHLTAAGHSASGVTTNAEGMFLLRLEISKPTKITVSGIGYHKYTFVVDPGVDAGIDIALLEKNTLLQEVMVTPGTNPANSLMARVRAMREQNAPHTMDVNNTDAKTQVFLSDIQSRHLNQKMWKSVQANMIEQEDSSYLLPIYSRKTHEGQQDIHSTILSDGEYESLLAGLEKAPNFYHNTLPLYSTSFLSPLASDGNTYYRYYLLDSLVTESGKHYIVDFRTRNPYYATFNGQMEIDSATAGLVRISATVPALVNANYLKNATIEQTYLETSPGIFSTIQSSQVNMLLDVAVKTDNSHIFPSVLITQEMANGLNAVGTQNATFHDITPERDSIVAAIDTLNNTPLFRVARFLAYSVSTGYIPTGSYVEVGNVSEILKITPQETVRLGLPLRTSEKLWKNICLEAYAAYGFGDQAWKGAGMIHFNLPTVRRHQLTARYADEYVYSDISDFTMLKRENAAWFRYMGYTTSILRIVRQKTRHDYNPLVRQQEFRIQSEDDWTDHLETQFCVAIGRMGYGEPTKVYGGQPTFRYANLNATFRLSWDEKRVDLYFRRIHVYNNKPVLYLNGEIGSYMFDGEHQTSTSAYQLYGKLRLLLRQQVSLGVVGQLNYLLEAGCIFGSVPYPFLNIFDANPTFFYDQRRFSLMSSYRYAADKYVALHADWNGRGCLFNLIPGIRCLHLRELAVFKLGYGGLSSRHEQVLAFPNSTADFPRLEELHTPYIEMGVGIGNILRIGELYSLWRLTNRDDPSAPKWTLRLRLYIDK